MTNNPDDAAELTQETYLIVFRKVGQFQGDADISTWICRIAINEARQLFRRRKLRERNIENHKLVEVENIHPQGDLTDTRMDIEDALRRLAEFERALIVLRYFEGFSYSQMAEILKKPAGTIASGLNRARQMLREILEPKSASKD